MIRLIRFLITGDWHLHEWEKDGPQLHSLNMWDEPVNYRQPCRCKRCGKIKSFKL